jgi:hypothetical protein
VPIEIVTETRLRVSGDRLRLGEMREFMRNVDEVSNDAEVVIHQTQAHPMERGMGATTLTVKGVNH